ncbi:MAG: hypothetical protein WCJ56_08450 [bacterium]
MRLFVVMLALICCSFLTQAQQWETYQSTIVNVSVHPGQQEVARLVTSLADGDVPRIAATLGVTQPGPFAVYAYTDAVEFMTDAGHNPYLRGVSYRPSGVIRVNATATVAELRRTLAHELTHSLLNQLLGDNIGRLPLWVDEGIAGHCSDPIDPANLRAAAQQMHQQGVLSLDELEHGFENDRNRDAAYLQSRAMIAWLEFNYPGALRNMLAQIASGESFPTALKATTNLTPEIWLNRWQQDVPFWVTLIPLMNSPVIFAPFAILVVVVVILRERKRRAEEEAIEKEANALADEEEERKKRKRMMKKRLERVIKRKVNHNRGER